MALMAGPALAGHHEGGDEGKMCPKGKMFEETDTNGDGVVTMDEFMAKSAEKFATMDADKDGSVSQDEFKKHWEDKKAHMEKMKEEHGKK